MTHPGSGRSPTRACSSYGTNPIATRYFDTRGLIPRSRFSADDRSRPAIALRRVLQERDEQPAHLAGLLLLHPVSGALDQVKAHHARARGLLHGFGGTRGLVGAPVALAADEAGRHVDGAAGERMHLGDALGVRAAS